MFGGALFGSALSARRPPELRQFKTAMAVGVSIIAMSCGTSRVALRIEPATLSLLPSRASRNAWQDERPVPSESGAIRFIYECATVITTFPFLCPRSTYLNASAICSKG